jgi:hypothetical protein
MMQVETRHKTDTDTEYFEGIIKNTKVQSRNSTEDLQAELDRYRIRPLSEAARTVNNVVFAIGKTQGVMPIIFKSGEALWLFSGLSGMPEYTYDQKENGCWCFCTEKFVPVDESLIKGWLPIDTFHKEND